MQGNYQKSLPSDMTVTKIGYPRRDSQSFENGQELKKALQKYPGVSRKLNKYFRVFEMKHFRNVQNQICTLTVGLSCYH